MARVLGHRQTKGAATDKPDLLPPRYIPTLPTSALDSVSTYGSFPPTKEPIMHAVTNIAPKADGREIPWNKGKLIGQKPPLKLKEIWAIRIRLQLDHRARELALFNLAIDSKLRGCDLVGLHVRDVFQSSHVAPRAIVMQKKTQRPVQFEITEQTREAVSAWIATARLKSEQFLFPSRMSRSPHLSTRQYSRIVHTRAGLIGLD